METPKQYDDVFVVDWENKEDQEHIWRRNEPYTPNVMKPLDFDLHCKPFTMGMFPGTRLRLINYYVYVNQTASKKQRETFTCCGVSSLKEHLTQWQTKILPEVLELIDYYLSVCFHSKSNKQLVDELNQLVKIRFRSGQLHAEAFGRWKQSITYFLTTWKELTGATDVEGLSLLQTYKSKQVETSEELWHLGITAAYSPHVRALIDQGHEDVFQTLKASSNTQHFVRSFESFLQQYGWRSAATNEPSVAPWSEDPSVPISLIKKHMNNVHHDPVLARNRFTLNISESFLKTLERLDRKDRFVLDKVTGLARELAAIGEDHAFYIDQKLMTVARRLILAVGERLKSTNVIEREQDVFVLHQSELADLLLNPTICASDLVYARKNELGKWMTVRAPQTLGGDRSTKKETPNVAYTRDQHDNYSLVLSGEGGSSGTARGPARILHGLEEADKLQHGDILIARTTLPTWTPLFAIAAGVVVERGGLLSHPAVAAREFGIPVVLGVVDATNLIYEGRNVHVDGTEGKVRVEH